MECRANSRLERGADDRTIDVYLLTAPSASLLCSTQVVDAVHSKGSFIYLQLWALGRLADPHILREEGPFPYVSASDVKLTNNQSVSYTSSSAPADEDIALRPLTTDGNSSFSDMVCC